MAAPILQSLLLADHVYRDQSTGKHIICGVFSTIFFTPNVAPEKQDAPGTPERHADTDRPGFGNSVEQGSRPEKSPPAEGVHGRSDPIDPPATRPLSIQNLIQAGSPYVYFSVTELNDRKVFEVRYVELNENRVLFQAEVPIECDDPLKTIEISLPLPRLPLVALEERSYALEVLCEGQLLGSHRVLARMAPGAVPPPPAN